MLSMVELKYWNGCYGCVMMAGKDHWIDNAALVVVVAVVVVLE